MFKHTLAIKQKDIKIEYNKTFSTTAALAMLFSSTVYCEVIKVATTKL